MNVTLRRFDIVLILIIGIILVSLGMVGWAPERLRVATTTSLYDTGLWGHLEPMFEKQYNVELDIIYAGTGIALEWGRRGGVDVLTIHCKAREKKFIADGYGIQRVPFAYNYFLIVGPEDDPAGVLSKNIGNTFKNVFGQTGL